jgi:peptidoglycan/LPS O-acetylase OafA/YrhL
MVTQPARTSPVVLRLAAAAQGAEAVGLAVAAVFSAISTAGGQSYQLASGIALTVIAFGTAAALAALAVGLNRARPWTRIPVVMTQVFVIIAGFTLLDGHRPEWGVPTLVLAVACLAALFAPASLRALNRPPVSPPAQNPPIPSPPAKTPQTKRPPAKTPQTKRPQAKRQPAK